MRQCSIAHITFIWSRLTCPALAKRQAEPWSRKMSATSSAGRAIRRSALGGRLVLFGLPTETLQRAHDRADGLGGDARIKRGCLQLRMPEQNLNHTNVDVLLQKVGCKTMSQRVWRHPLGDLGHVGRCMAGAVKLARRYRLQRVLSRWTAKPLCAMRHQSRRSSSSTGESIANRSLRPLPCSTRNIMRLLSMSDTFSDADLRHAQPRPIGDAERRLVLDAGRRLQKARHLLGAENDGDLARLRAKRQVLDDVGPVERNGEEKPQRRNRTVDGRRADAVRGEMQLEKPQVLIDAVSGDRCRKIVRFLTARM